jgi:hypothetical protein
VNDDGHVNSIDALLILQFDADIITSLANLRSADVNQNGRVNSIDAALILQYEAGLIHVLPPPQPAGSRGPAVMFGLVLR